MTRRFNTAMTEDAYRRLRRLAQEAGLDEGEALSFLFENFDIPPLLQNPKVLVGYDAEVV
jgi:hypothetical protein